MSESSILSNYAFVFMEVDTIQHITGVSSMSLECLYFRVHSWVISEVNLSLTRVDNTVFSISNVVESTIIKSTDNLRRQHVLLYT